MGDPQSRKSAAVNRLRNNLHKKRESLADQFEFKILVAIQYYPCKEKQTKSSLFECIEVLPVMTNNYEQSIMDGVKNDSYSYESSRELIDKDIVQFHVHSWKPIRRDIVSSKAMVDFLLWPRTDIESIQCHLFSRWKGDSAPYRHINSRFIIQSCDYEPQLRHLLTVQKRTGLLTINPEQTTFLFVDKHYLKLGKNGSQPALTEQDKMKKVIIFRLRSLCLYLPQDQLMGWDASTLQDLVAHHFTSSASKVKRGQCPEGEEQGKTKKAEEEDSAKRRDTKPTDVTEKKAKGSENSETEKSEGKDTVESKDADVMAK